MDSDRLLSLLTGPWLQRIPDAITSLRTDVWEARGRDAGAKAVGVGSSAWFGEASLQASVQLFTHMLRR